jgi:peptide/nickel transport system permease protein
MTAYLIRRLFQMLIVLLLSAAFTYALFNYAPGGPLQGIRQQQQRISAQDFARLRARFELDLYGPVRFSRWLIGWPNGPIYFAGREWFANTPVGCYIFNDATGVCEDYVYLAEIPEIHPAIRSSRGILRGDFGQSTVVRQGRPAVDEILSRLRPTLELMITSTIFALLIGVPIGIYSAVRQYSRFDNFFSTVAFFGSSMPTFFFGLLLILLFAVMPVFWEDRLPWLLSLPPGGREGVRPYEIATWLPRIEPGSIVDRGLRMLMPVTVLTFTGVATWSRFVRASMLEVLRQDYVRTARAKGLIERLVIGKHALRNALIPFITILVLQIPNLFAGAIITESVFAWPGMGQLFINALNQNDYPIALAFIFITTVLTIMATLLGDILYTIIDPRIRFT